MQFKITLQCQDVKPVIPNQASPGIEPTDHLFFKLIVVKRVSSRRPLLFCSNFCHAQMPVLSFDALTHLSKKSQSPTD